jgi:hypothetical protein
MGLRQGRGASAATRTLCCFSCRSSGKHRLQQRPRDARFSHFELTQLVRCRIQMFARRVSNQVIPEHMDVPVGKASGSRVHAGVGVLGLLPCRFPCWRAVSATLHKIKGRWCGPTVMLFVLMAAMNPVSLWVRRRPPGRLLLRRWRPSRYQEIQETR